MSSVYITRRRTQSGEVRHIVRYRRGGRYTPLVHAGSFKTRREADERLKFVSFELAAARNPRETLHEMLTATPPPQLGEWFDRFAASRVDVSAKTESAYRHAQARLRDLATKDPHTLREADLREWIAQQQVDSDDWPALSPATIRKYLGSIAQVLDFAEVKPSPLRSKRVKVPRYPQEELSPPDGVEWARIRERLSPRMVLPLRLIECCGLRVSECVQLWWGDVDFAEGRLRISAARTKRTRGMAGQRWLWVPDELLEAIADLRPFEDRDMGMPVFPGLTDGAVRKALEAACKLAGTVLHSPHDLRHRRISRWVTMRIDPVTAKEWAGHSNPSMTLSKYSHVIIGGTDEWERFWLDRYRQERFERPSEVVAS